MFNNHGPTDVVLYKQTRIEKSMYGPVMCSQYPSYNQFVKNKQIQNWWSVIIKETETVCTCTTRRKLGRVPQKTLKNYYSLRHRPEFGVTVNFYIVFNQLNAVFTC